MKQLMVISCMVIALGAYAQNVGINPTGSAAHASAILDVSSTEKGILIPRVTEVQRSAIAGPATGLLVYQTNGAPTGFYYYNGTQWQALGGADNLGNHSATQNIALGSNYISRTGAANTGLRINVDNMLQYRAVNTNNVLGDRFRVDNSGGVVAIGELGIGIIPSVNAGVRMMWHPFKAAFRAGGVDGSQWDEAGTGFYSVALGTNTVASALGSFAVGDRAQASAINAISMGNLTSASGAAAIAVGASSTASGFASVTMGFSNRALGDGSVAIGYRNSSTQDYAISIGYRAVARHTGALALSDASTTDSLLSTNNNQFNARYAGGYRLFTNATRTTGVSIVAGGGSWATISDSARKEKFVPARHEDFLENLSTLRLGSWNYIGQDEPGYRHYGPMAQEIFAANGRDAYGTIGNDTTLASADMDGLMMIMLQGLEKRTANLQATNRKLEEQLAALSQQHASLQTKLAQAELLEQKLAKLMDLLEKKPEVENTLD
jgi:hypothetical protein